MSSEITPPMTFAVAVSGGDVDCAGNFRYSRHGHGIVSASLRSVCANVTVAFEPRPPASIPVICRVLSCDIEVPGTGVAVEFHGVGLETHLLEVFRGMIAKAVALVISDASCPVVESLAVNVTNILTALVDAIPADSYVPPAAPDPTIGAGAADLRQSSIVDMARYVSGTLAGPSGVRAFASLVGGPTGTLIAPPEVLQQMSLRRGFRGGVWLDVALRSLRVTGLQNTEEVGLLYPRSDTTLRSRFSAGAMAVNASLGVTLTLPPGILGAGAVEIYEEVDVALAADHMALDLEVFLAVSSAALDALSSTEVLSPDCLLSTLMSANITDLYLNATNPNIAVVFTGAPDGGVQATANAAVSMLLRAYKPLFHALTVLAMADVARGDANAALQEAIDGARCTVPSVAPLQLVNVGWTAGSLAGAAVGCVALLVVIKRHGPKTVRRALGEQVREPLMGEREPEEEDTGEALAFHPRLSFAQRFWVPALALISIAVFNSATSSTDGTVRMSFTAGAKTYRYDPIFDFNVKTALDDMWSAGVYALALLLTVSLCVWPYVKLVTTIVLWFLPSRKLKPRWRDLWLSMLDAFGKWSMIDSYIMTLMAAGFRFHVAPAPIATPGGAFAVDVYMQFEDAFYIYIAAVVLSLVTSHLALALHRITMPRAEEHHKPTSLRSIVRRRANGRLVRCLMPWEGLIVLGIATLVLIVAGAGMNAFSFEFEGAAGLALAFFHEPTGSSFSTVGNGEALTTSSAGTRLAGVHILQVVFFLFAVVMPLLSMTMLMLLWLLPTTRKVRARLFLATEICYAWGALDVFVVAIIVALLEISRFAGFIVGQRCDVLNVYLVKYGSSILDGNTTCAAVTASLEHGLWLLVAASVTSFLVGHVILHLARSVERESAAAPSVAGAQTLNG